MDKIHDEDEDQICKMCFHDAEDVRKNKLRWNPDNWFGWYCPFKV